MAHLAASPSWLTLNWPWSGNFLLIDRYYQLSLLPSTIIIYTLTCAVNTYTVYPLSEDITSNHSYSNFVALTVWASNWKFWNISQYCKSWFWLSIPAMKPHFWLMRANINHRSTINHQSIIISHHCPLSSTIIHCHQSLPAIIHDYSPCRCRGRTISVAQLAKHANLVPRATKLRKRRFRALLPPHCRGSSSAKEPSHAPRELHQVLGVVD